jgi:hypothetical protein
VGIGCLIWVWLIPILAKQAGLRYDEVCMEKLRGSEPMKYAIVIVVLVVLAYLVMAFNSRTEELTRLTDEQQAVQTQLSSRQQTKAAIEAQIQFSTSEAAVREWAYKNHLAQPGDQIVIPVSPSESTPTPLPITPVTPQKVQPNWQRWLSLFIEPETANTP